MGDDPATDKVLKSGKKGKLKALVKWGIGVDNIDIDACKRLEIKFSNTPDIFGDEVADIAIGYMIALSRNTFLIDREIRKGNWVKPTGSSLKGKTVGILGLGDILYDYPEIKLVKNQNFFQLVYIHFHFYFHYY